MKKIFEILHTLIGFLKIIFSLVACAYIFFWFYRFFNLPGAENIALIFDVPLKIFSLNLLYNDDGRIAENGYYVIAVALFIFAVLLGKIEKILNRLAQKQAIKDEERKIYVQEQKELSSETERIKGVMNYKYFSIILKYKIWYDNELIAQNNSVTIVDTVERAYSETVFYLRRAVPEIGIKQNKGSLFIRGIGFEKFNEVMSCLLNGMKTVKMHNAKDYMGTDFLIVIDAQKTQEESGASMKMMEKITDMQYYGKAVATRAFKNRFELMPESPYMLDVLGISAMGKYAGDDELFSLKTKPKI